MSEQLPPARGLRLALLALATLEVATGVVALWLVRRGTGPLLPVPTQRLLAYAWVALTIGAAAGAYLIARAAAGAPRRRPRAIGAAAALAHFAAIAGIVIFWLVRVWPMLVVALLVALLALVLAWPAARASVPAGVEEAALH